MGLRRRRILPEGCDEGGRLWLDFGQAGTRAAREEVGGEMVGWDVVEKVCWRPKTAGTVTGGGGHAVESFWASSRIVGFQRGTLPKFCLFLSIYW
jgi:hypothetical protein